MLRKNHRQGKKILAGVLVAVVLVVLAAGWAKRYAKAFLGTAGRTLLDRAGRETADFFLPLSLTSARAKSPAAAVWDQLVDLWLPAYACYGMGGQSAAGEYEALWMAEQENAQFYAMLEENEAAAEELSDWKGKEEMAEAKPKKSGDSSGKKPKINRKKLSDFDYIYQTFYQVDSTTTIGKDQLNAEALLGKDMTLKETKGEEPQILIYHTHSQETYRGCEEGDPSTSVVGVGDYLTELLTGYGYKVLHHKGEYDVENRDQAYTYALPALEEILEEHPSIQVVIDLHRDSVPEHTRLVTEIDGKKTAQIMFFNGLSHTTALGDITSLPNKNRPWNLAFSFQMQLAAAENYPGLTRRIYLKGYRYNMHLRAQSMLVEVGAQNNTFEEAKNAMEPLSFLLHEVLSGKYSE